MPLEGGRTFKRWGLAGSLQISVAMSLVADGESGAPSSALHLVGSIALFSPISCSEA